MLRFNGAVGFGKRNVLKKALAILVNGFTTSVAAKIHNYASFLSKHHILPSFFAMYKNRHIKRFVNWGFIPTKNASQVVTRNLHHTRQNAYNYPPAR